MRARVVAILAERFKWPTFGRTLVFCCAVLALVALPGSAVATLAPQANHPADTANGADARTIRAPLVIEPGSVVPGAGTQDSAANQTPAPVRLIIPKMGLNTPIIALGPDANGAMQAPQPAFPNDPILHEVYWWDVGAHPGETGNAVIAGHINLPDGKPATFGNLNLLTPGDLIQVERSDGSMLTFRVTDKNTPLVYVQSSNDPTIGRIFGPAATPNLNLLTCWGTWDGTTYNRRLVVYSTLVSVTPAPRG